ncbi:phosphoribosylformylglycinamidine cyclo-ligase [Candidatus Bathyarchaeota archaeon]|nr:MAG: phosphoribosylformylglycinamidine cyclo-ligase [Candidatus Bathyarchaeota archaeon]
MVEGTPRTYKDAGVDVEEEDKALKLMIEWCSKTFNFRSDIGKPVIPIGHFAGIIKFLDKYGLVLKTDGVGSKVFIAQLMNKYDTVGIDCVAMNVNDVICVGAEPLSFVDYIALQKPDKKMLEEIAKGLYEGAKLAKVTIVGGEVAQLPEMIKGKREGYGFDLVGMCIGVVDLEKIVDGKNLVEGDVVIGLESSGIHSNGLTLARKVLLDGAGMDVFSYIDEFGCTLGEELLKPTKIYVQEVMEMIKAGLNIKVLANITGKGLLNLLRVGEGYGYVLENLPQPHPIFKLIQKIGKIPEEEMYSVYNMGVGFCIVTSKEDADKVIDIAEKHKTKAYKLGFAVKDPERKLYLKSVKLLGFKGKFKRV